MFADEQAQSLPNDRLSRIIDAAPLVPSRRAQRRVYEFIRPVFHDSDNYSEDVRRAAIRMLPLTAGAMESKAADLAAIVRRGLLVADCFNSLDAIPTESWIDEIVPHLCSDLIGWLADLSVQDQGKEKLFLARRLAEKLSRRLSGEKRARFSSRIDQLLRMPQEQ